MKTKIFFFLLIITVAFPASIQAQNNSVNFKVGDRVEAEYTTWYPGKVVEVLSNGDQYKVELYPPNGGKSFVYSLPKFRLRAAKAPIKTATKTTALVYGKYNCTATKYTNGSYEYIPRGSIVITKSGKYTYNGFSKPSNGTYTVDKDGNLLFKGGYLNGGKAEKIDRPNKFFLTFPTNPDNRWTCSLID